MRLFFLIVSLAWMIYSACGDSFVAPKDEDIDFTGFHKAVLSAIATSKQSELIQPLTDKSTIFDCHFPDSAIMLTLSTFYNVDQLALQHKAMEVWGMKECLESRFVSVCLDTKCMDVCRDNSIKNCYLLPFEMGPIPPEEFMGASFRFLMYLKHLLMHEALKVVKEVIFFDVDVELFKNPFVDTLYRRRDDGSRDLSSPPPDMMWQAERKYNMSCAGTPNGGQLFLRNSTRLAKYWEVFFAHRESFLGRGKSDQEQMLELVAEANITYCSLPYTRFTAQNLFKNAVFNATAPAVETVSYHTSGVSGNVKKLMHLDLLLKGLTLVKNNATTSDNQQFLRYWLEFVRNTVV